MVNALLSPKFGWQGDMALLITESAIQLKPEFSQIPAAYTRKAKAL